MPDAVLDAVLDTPPVVDPSQQQTPVPVDTPKTPVPEPTPEPKQEYRFFKEDFEKIQSVDDAKKFREQLTEQEREAWDKGDLDKIFGEKKDEATVAEGETSVEPDPILSPEEYDTADPRTKAMQDKIIDLAEQLETAMVKTEDPAVAELRSLINSDPVLKTRIDLAIKGEAVLPTIDIPPEAFLTDEAMKLLDEAFITDDNLVSAKAALADFVKKVYNEAAMRVKVNLEGTYMEREEIANRKLFYQNSISEFVRSNPEYASPEPIFVEKDNGTSINDNHKVKPFIAWLTKEVNEGRVTHEAIKEHGLAAYDHLFKIKTAGGVSSFNKSRDQISRNEALAKLREARKQAIMRDVAPTMKPSATAATVPAKWYDYDLNRLKVDKAYAEQTIAQLKDRRETNKLAELVELAKSW